MDVTTALPKVPTRNLGRMSLAEFGRVWAAAERAATDRGPWDYYLAGVVMTLRWVAGKEITSPVTRAARWVMPESVDAEYMAAIRAARNPRLHPMRNDIARGVVAVLGWLYHQQPEPALTPDRKSVV